MTDDEEDLLPEHHYDDYAPPPPLPKVEVNRRPKREAKSNYESSRNGKKQQQQQQVDIEKGMMPQQQSPREEASLERRAVLKASDCSSGNIQDRYSYAEVVDYNNVVVQRRDMVEAPRTPMVVEQPLTRILPQRPPPFVAEHVITQPRRKLPEIPKQAKLTVRCVVPPEPNMYPSSFHSSFDEGDAATVMHHSNPQLTSGQPPHTVYESYHQQFRQLKRQHSSPMGSRQLPMAPFGHRRTASSASFGHVPNIASPGMP